MENLFSGFQPLSLAEWKKNIEKSLKGKTFDQLSVTDDNGILIHPVYNAETTIAVGTKKTSVPLFYHHDWNVCTELNVTNEKELNSIALAELNGGADALNFIIGKETGPEALLKEIQVEHIRANFTFTTSPVSFISKFEKLIKEKKLSGEQLNGFFCYDHLYSKPGEEFLKEWKNFVSLSLFKETNYSPFCFDVSAYHSRGANTVTELAYFVLQLNEYLNFAEQNKISFGNKEIVIVVSVGNNFFESVAKLRALRKLFALLTKQYGLKNPLYLHCKNSLVNKSTLDIHNNLLRSTTEGMAAVIGGANSLSVFPFNNVIKENDPEALRWARNQQIIFKEEAALNKVADMSAGSYYIETLTTQLAENAWKIFQAIEGEGGFIECINNGFIPELIAAMANKQKGDFAAGKKILVGVNKFSNEKEKVFERLAEKVASPALSGGEMVNLILSAETENSVAAKKKEHA